ncbi:MAG TPA: DNA adenine methylase [Thermoanaerobaculia bacterium]|nr:DNA adenine methylase [Thermoanaerobaculia bacterium]
MPESSGHGPDRPGRPTGDGPPPGAAPPPPPAPQPPSSRPTRRALLRYFGGKTSLAPWIVSHLPPHRCYTEAYGGGAAVLLQKPRSPIEVYNDLDSAVVGLFRVLRDPAAAARLVDLVALTPYSRQEFLAAYEPADDPVEAARRLLVRSHMGHGGEAACGRKTGFRRLSHRRHLRGTHPALDWARFPQPLAHFADRLRAVVVEHADAAEVLSRYDSADTVHYLDPPYPKASRRTPCDHLYAHDLDDADHVALADLLHTLRGPVLISGYASPLYDRLYAGWHRLEQSAIANGGGKRREILWLSRRPDDLFS